MAAFLRRYGYVRSTNGTIVSYGFSSTAVGHAARYYNSSWAWTSKLGEYLLINHPRDQLAVGYGQRRHFFARSGFTEAESLVAAPMIEPGEDDFAPLSSDDQSILDELVAAVPADLASQYREAWDAWTQAIDASERLAMDSSTLGFTQVPAFAQLAAFWPGDPSALDARHGRSCSVVCGARC